MTYVVAVSGGVDSVALLDMMVKSSKRPVVVAHFDHGIRADSSKDADLVQGLATLYGVPFESRREELGPGAGEALARERRYTFLREVAQKHDAQIVTAHHADDVIETIAINLHRGTGWRGLAVLDSDILRPLLSVSKDDLRAYAKKHHLPWREDTTNTDLAYLRNRIRPHARALPDDHKKQLHSLSVRQKELKRHIEAEVRELVGEGPLFGRYFISHMPKKLAVECLRVMTNGALTRPQIERFLLAIKTALPGTTYQAGSGVIVHFTARYFTL